MLLCPIWYNSLISLLTFFFLKIWDILILSYIFNATLVLDGLCKPDLTMAKAPLPIILPKVYSSSFVGCFLTTCSTVS